VTLHLNGQGLVSTAQFFALWRALEELTADPGLGIKLVESAETAVYPPSSLAAFHARDYRDGLSRLARFKRLCTPEQLHLSEQGGECSITWERIYATEAEPPIAVDDSRCPVPRRPSSTSVAKSNAGSRGIPASRSEE
jgi:hypothetical protein